MNTRLLTIREALKIEPLNRAKVIAGKKGLDNIVRGVNIMEVPDIQSYIHQDELLVSTLYPLRDSKLVIVDLIRILSEKGLAGLAIKFNRYISPFTKNILEKADQLAFPILELPDDIAFVDIVQSITSRILDLKTKELERSISIHKQFIELVLQGGEISDIAKSAAKLLKLHVTIIDNFYKILASSISIHSKFDPDLIEKYGNDFYLSPQLKREVISKKKDDFTIQFRINKSKESAKFIEFLSYPIQVGSVNMGEILLWRDNNKSSDFIDLNVLENCSASISLKLMEEKNNRQIKLHYRKEVLNGLLSDQRIHQESAIRSALDLGYRLQPPYIVLIVLAYNKKEETLSYENYAKLDEVLFYVKRKIRFINPNTIFWNQGSKLIIFFPLDNRFDLKESLEVNHLTFSLESITEDLYIQDSPFSISIGVSNIESDLFRFFFASECAIQSLNVGRLLNHKQNGVVTKFSDIGIFRLVGLGTKKHGSILFDFCNDSIGKLIEYDKEHGTNYLETLKIYLDNNQNIKKTAKFLFVHYNTIRYRINRILEILGNFLDFPQERLAVEFSLQIHSLLSSSDFTLEDFNNLGLNMINNKTILNSNFKNVEKAGY